MASALRLNTLLGRQFRPGTLALDNLRSELRLLDGLCRTLGVTELSHFVDTTALELQAAAAMLAAESGMTADQENDPETDLPYGIEDVSWYPVSAGMSTLEALEQHLRRTPHTGLDSIKERHLTKELEYCISALTPLEAEGAQFHLAAEDQR